MQILVKFWLISFWSYHHDRFDEHSGIQTQDVPLHCLYRPAAPTHSKATLTWFFVSRARRWSFHTPDHRKKQAFMILFFIFPVTHLRAQLKACRLGPDIGIFGIKIYSRKKAIQIWHPNSVIFYLQVENRLSKIFTGDFPISDQENVSFWSR